MRQFLDVGEDIGGLLGFGQRIQGGEEQPRFFALLQGYAGVVEVRRLVAGGAGAGT